VKSYAAQVRRFYEGEVARHGYSYRGLGYNHQSSHQRRFEILAEVGPLHGRSVLDVGAGLGDFLLHLWKRGVIPAYTGIDLCDHLVLAARRRFESDRRGACGFFVADVLELSSDVPYDYVVASGIFGLETGVTAERIEATLRKMFELCREGIAVNFLSARAERHAPQSLYVEPGEILAAALALSPAVVLRHDYLPNDFTLFVYRQPRWPFSEANQQEWRDS
jgi:SAM-dependent methyltransferase